MSLLTRTLLIVAAAALGVLIISGWAVREIFFEGQVTEWHRQASGTVLLASEQIISDPSGENIDRIAARLGMNIAWTGPGGHHASDPEMPDPAAIEVGEQRRRFRGFQRHLSWNLLGFREDGRNYILHLYPPHRIVYGLARRAELWDDTPTVLVISLSLLSALFIGVFLLLRVLLRPLRTVAEKLGEIGSAEGSDLEVPRWSSWDVGQLVTKFNQMRQHVTRLLQSKETLLRDVSHEVRSPLARLRLALEFVSDEKLRQRMVEDINDIDRLSGELLERARLEEGDKSLLVEDTDMAALVRDVVASFSAEQQKFFKLSLPKAPPRAVVDVRLVARALTNLLANSLRHSELEPHSIRVRLVTAVSGKKARVVLSVADAGPRLAAEVVVRLFDSFFRVDKARTQSSGGFGLGLAIVDSIVRAHGGSAHLVSPESGGLRCTLTFPVAGPGS